MSGSPQSPLDKENDLLEQRLVWSRYANAIGKRSSIPFLVTLVASVFAAIGLFGEPPGRFAGVNSLEAKDERTKRVEQVQEEVSETFRLQRPDLFLVYSVARDVEPEDIRGIRAAIAQVRELPQVARALWIDDVPAVNLLQLTRSILPADTISREGFQEELEKVKTHPLAYGQLMSLDGREFLVPIEIDWLEVSDDQATRDQLLSVSRQAISATAGSQVSVDATGDVPLYLDQLSAHRRNQSRFQWIGYSLVIIVASLMYRSPLPVILVGLAPAAGIFWSTAALRWLGEPANPLSDSVLPVLVAIVGVTDGVHLLAVYRDGLAKGLTPRQATSHSIEEVAQACFLTSLTTAIGFLSLMWADSELVRGFGRACAIGVTLAFIAMLTVFPLFAANAWIGKRVPGRHLTDHGKLKLDGLIMPLLARPRTLAWIGTFATIAMSVCLLYLKADDRRAYGLPTASPSFRTLERVDKAFGGIESAQVMVEWNESLDESPELLEVLREVEQAVSAEPKFGRALSLATIANTMELTTGSRPFDFVALIPSVLRDSLYSANARRAVVSFRLQDLGVAAIDPMLAGLESRLQTISAKHPNIELSLTGDGVLRGRRIVRIVDDLKWSLVGAGVIIFSMLAVFVRSWKLGLIAIVPNVFPIAFSAGVLLLMGRQLDVSAACALTVCLGIAVDDSIHFLTRYQRELSSGQSAISAVRSTLQKVGSSLVATTVIMTIGFSTVLISEMPSQRIFGAMSVATITTALIADLLLLPAILLAVDRRIRGTAPHGGE